MTKPLTDDEGEKAYIDSVLEGVKAFADRIDLEFPGGRRLLFFCAAGFIRPDGIVLQVICNRGDEGLRAVIRQLQQELQRRRAD